MKKLKQILPCKQFVVLVCNVKSSMHTKAKSAGNGSQNVTGCTSSYSGLFVDFFTVDSLAWSATVTRTTGLMLLPARRRPSRILIRICQMEGWQELPVGYTTIHAAVTHCRKHGDTWLPTAEEIAQNSLNMNLEVLNFSGPLPSTSLPPRFPWAARQDLFDTCKKEKGMQAQAS